MRNLWVGVAVAAFLCAAPLSLRWSHGNGMSLSAAFDSADAAELSVPGRYYRSAIRHRRYAARLYNFHCDGPYMGGGFNGGTYYGGPWIDLGCYSGVY
jgi:hypothetical protein